MKLQKIKIGMIIICMLAAGICYSCDKRSTSTETELRTAGREPALTESGSKESGGQEQQAAEDAKPETMCYVHICGEVKNPGVYELPDNQRVFHVVELAGGFTGNAATEYLNLADVVKDGMKLVVPSKDELEKGMPELAAKDTQAAPKININQASKEQLMTLKGIGESRAEDIISFREERGRFEKIEDIMKVPGIKEAAFSKIQEDITV